MDVERSESHFPSMARRLRVEFPGAIYHIMNRRDRREPIFKDGALMTWPESFLLVTKNNQQEWIPVRAEDVSAEAGLAAVPFERPAAGKPSES